MMQGDMNPMKRHRTLSWLVVLIVLLTLTAPIGMAGAAPAKADPPPRETPTKPLQPAVAPGAVPTAIQPDPLVQVMRVFEAEEEPEGGRLVFFGG